MRIVTENLGKRFNREWIFKNMTITLESGRVYAITGPNGSGKSTLLQVLWGQMPASAGSLRYMHADAGIDHENIHQHLVIAAPYLELIDEFTLEEMVRFHFKFKKVRAGLTTTEVIEKMELLDARTKFIRQFSSGMKQRLKLALAFFSEAEIIFLDEPTTNLDKNATRWYLNNLASCQAPLVIIASNQEHEYPETAKKINILDFKAVVTS
ncbi:MAG: ABC transporter ATP-binding protein [Bacteroidota bacterium]